MGLLYQPQDQIKTISGRKSNNKPLLFLFSELTSTTTHIFCDPYKNKFRYFDYPELNLQLQCLSSGFGWLLLLSRQTNSLFFFNPITRQRIELPYRNKCFDVAVFSAPPTSSNCIVFAIDKPYLKGYITIDVFRVGCDSMWSNGRHYCNDFKTVVQSVYSNGYLYCMDSLGRIGTYDINAVSWSTQYTSKCRIVRRSYMVESDGDVLAGARGAHDSVNEIYKLKIEGGKGVGWVKVKDLGDVANVFIGPYGSCAHAWSSEEDMEKKKTPSVFVAGYGPNRRWTVYNHDFAEETINTCLQLAGFHYIPIWVESSN